VLVDRAIQVGPPANDLDVGLVHEPPITESVPRRSREVDELRRERLYPPVHSDMVDGDATLGQQLLDIAVGQPIAEVPAHRHRDHLTGKWAYAGAGSQAAGSRVTL
jgi:hypothetical protein